MKKYFKKIPRPRKLLHSLIFFATMQALVAQAEATDSNVFSSDYCQTSLTNEQEYQSFFTSAIGSQRVLGDFNVASRYRRCYQQTDTCDDWQVGDPTEFKLFAGTENFSHSRSTQRSYNFQRQGKVKARIQSNRKVIVLEAADHSIATDWWGILNQGYFPTATHNWSFEFQLRDVLIAEDYGPMRWQGRLGRDCLYLVDARRFPRTDTRGNSYNIEVEVVGYARF